MPSFDYCVGALVIWIAAFIALIAVVGLLINAAWLAFLWLSDHLCRFRDRFKH